MVSVSGASIAELRAKDDRCEVLTLYDPLPNHHHHRAWHMRTDPQPDHPSWHAGAAIQPPSHNHGYAAVPQMGAMQMAPLQMGARRTRSGAGPAVRSLPRARICMPDCGIYLGALLLTKSERVRRRDRCHSRDRQTEGRRNSQPTLTLCTLPNHRCQCRTTTWYPCQHSPIVTYLQQSQRRGKRARLLPRWRPLRRTRLERSAHQCLRRNDARSDESKTVAMRCVGPFVVLCVQLTSKLCKQLVYCLCCV